MRLIKLVFLSLVLLGVFSADLRAQTPVTPCEDRGRSPLDLVYVQRFNGGPGDTVVAPVRIKNDSNIVSFRMLIQYDTTKLSPMIPPTDSTAIEFVIMSPRYLVDTTYPVQNNTDTLNGFSAFFYPNRRDVVSVLASYRPNPYFDPTDTTSPEFVLDSIEAGDDVVFGIKFIVNPLAAIGDSGQFNFFMKTTRVLAPNGIDSIAIACDMTEEAQAWTLGGATFSNTVYPQTPTTAFKVDTTPLAAVPTVQIEATDSSITAGATVALTWLTTDADSVAIFALPSTTPFRSSTSSVGIVNVSPTVTTTYRAIAYNEPNRDTASLTITVGGTTAGAPVVTAPQGLYTLKAGETVSFTVSATDAEGGQITLSANSATMPLGASFPSATNLNSVSSSFSWVPSTSQVGTFQVQFRAQDPQGNVGTLTVTIVVEQLQFDRLFSTSVEGQRPVGGLPGKEGVFFPVNLVSSKTVYGIQFDLNYPRTVLTVDSVVPSGRIPEYVIYDNIGQTPGDIRVVTFGLNNEPVIEQDTTDTLNPTAVLFVVVSIDSTAVPWNNARMRLTGGRESINPNPNIGSVELVTDSGVVFIDQRGDVNLDQIIDVADPVSIVGSIIGNFNLNSRQFDAGDLITDLFVDVFDLVADVNLIYGIPVSPAPVTPKDHAIVSLAYSDMSQGSQDILKVKSELPEQIAGVQLELQYDPSSVGLGMPSKTADNGNFTLQYRDDGNGRLKIVLYHMAPFKENELLQVGTADLVNVPIIARSDIKVGNKSQLRLTQALLSTSTAGAVEVSGVDAELPQTFMLRQNYPNPFNPSTTIEFYVAGGGESQVNLDIFNILGQRVKTLVDGPMSAGDHKVEWDATSNSGQRVATGVYLYRLTVGSESQTRKMLFLK
ncbi:MAG: FlgD immunoglobulin-like domain containing protein [Candidatus Zixiibacteriota bacterium]